MPTSANQKFYTRRDAGFNYTRYTGGNQKDVLNTLNEFMETDFDFVSVFDDFDRQLETKIK